METKKYIAVSYELFSKAPDTEEKLTERASEEHPYQFITGMGEVIEAFEEKLKDLSTDELFDFTLDPMEGYGLYEENKVLTLPISSFSVDGRIDKNEIFPGRYLPMVNEAGLRFEALVVEVREDGVVLDFNERLAGKSLHFKGKIIESRPASDEEIQGVVNRGSGEGCGCGCDSCGGGCEGGCGEEHGHDHEGCGCGHCH